MSKKIALRNENEIMAVCGPQDRNLEFLEEKFPVTVIPRGDQLILEGDSRGQTQVANLLDDYLDTVRNGGSGLDFRDFAQAWVRDSEASEEMADETIIVSQDGKQVQPRTVQQKEYIEAIREHDIVFGIGPAGTGKTYLAMAMALSYLNKNRVSRIVLTRPAVEAGETLGFLPGDLQEKVNPYLRPLYDAIYNLMDISECDQLIEEGIIEVAPLAFMRGRTLADSFVILDEAQNTTAQQMKMFLTRFGPSSIGVVTGDITQIDLPGGKTSGLVEAARILEGIEGLGFVEFTDEDVVRHSLVQKIINAYDQPNSS